MAFRFHFACCIHNTACHKCMLFWTWLVGSVQIHPLFIRRTCTESTFFLAKAREKLSRELVYIGNSGFVFNNPDQEGTLVSICCCALGLWPFFSLSLSLWSKKELSSPLEDTPMKVQIACLLFSSALSMSAAFAPGTLPMLR